MGNETTMIRNADYKYFLKLDLNIFETLKFKAIRRHYNDRYLISFLKLSLDAMPSGWISYEKIKEELENNTERFIEAMLKYKLFEQVNTMYHSYLVHNKYVHAHPLDERDRNTIQYIEWRRKVFERDNYTCQMCGEKGCRLNAHHIIHWAMDKDKRYDETNGITLCENCHKKVHKGGQRNGN